MNYESPRPMIPVDIVPTWGEGDLVDFVDDLSPGVIKSVVIEHGKPPYKVLTVDSQWTYIACTRGTGHDGWRHRLFKKAFQPVNLPNDLFEM